MEKKEQRIQDNILFLGNRDDVYQLYQAMDVFVLPSRYEGLPVVGIEAQFSGLSCVLSDKMTKETKISGGTVFLSLNQSIKDWAREILKQLNMGRKININNNGFDISKESDKLENYYEEIVYKK